MMKERKLQVFVSSTYTDLKEERQAAVQAILRAGHIPAGMELFTAGDRSQWEVIKRWIDESDVYLLIVGGRYGSIDQGAGKSYTHMEFDYAVEKMKPLFSLVLKKEFIDEKVKANGTDFIETINGQKLIDFKAEVTSNMVEFVEDIKDIQISVGNKLSELSYNSSLIGWVRGDKGIDAALLAEQIAKLSQENSELRRLASSKEQSSITYNGLSYNEVELMLKEYTEDFPKFKNLFEFLLLCGPNARHITRIPGFESSKSEQYQTILQALAALKIYVFNTQGDTFHATEDGHNFYLKALSKKVFTDNDAS